LIKRFNGSQHDVSEADIFVASQPIIKETNYNFDLIGVLAIDNSLNRVDFRAAEKTFSLLNGLCGLTDKKIIIETSIPKHHVFRALIEKDAAIFYDEELKERKELNFPPFRHLGIIKLRGARESQVKEASLAMFEELNKAGDKSLKIISVNPGQPGKLRGKFYWQILVSGHSPDEITRSLKKYLKDFKHSGIIVTVDIDPA